MPLILFAAICLTGGLVLALTGDRHASGSAFRTAMYNQLTKRFGSAVSTVDCPDDLPTRDGATFDCVVHFGAEPLTVHVRVVRNGRKPAAQFSTDRTVVDVAATVNSIHDDVVRRTASHNVTVDCGESPVRLEPPGGSFPCRLAIDGNSSQVTVTVGVPGEPLDYAPRPPASA